MTVKEYEEKYKGQYIDVEIYVDTDKPKPGFHTDRIKEVDASDDTEVIEASLMDKEEYSSTILANTSTTWEDYGLNDNNKILVLKIEKTWQ